MNNNPFNPFQNNFQPNNFNQQNYNQNFSQQNTQQNIYQPQQNFQQNMQQIYQQQNYQPQQNYQQYSQQNFVNQQQNYQGNQNFNNSINLQYSQGNFNQNQQPIQNTNLQTTKQNFNPIYVPEKSIWNFNPMKMDEKFPMQMFNYENLKIQSTNFLDLAPPQAQNMVQNQTKLLRDSIQQYLSSLPLIQDIINQILKYLIPEQLYLPLKGLYDVIVNIPIEKLQSFREKSKQTVSQFAIAVEKGDFMPKSKIEALKKVTDALLENQTIRRELLIFGGKFEILGTFITEFLPLEFFEKFSLVIKNFSTIYIENFRDSIYQIPQLLSHGETIIKDVIQLLNPIDFFTVYFDILDKNKDGKLSLEELIDVQSHLEFFKQQKFEKSQLFEKMKSESTQLIQLLNNMNIVDSMIQSMYKIDFDPLYQILIMVKNSILNFNKEKFKRYIEILKELYQFIKDHKQSILNILNPNHKELAGLILNIFYEEPEFVKEATELFKDIFNTIDVEKVIIYFEQIITYFESVDLFKNIERFDFIGMACEKLKSTLSNCHHIYQKIKEIISIAVQRCIEILKMGTDELAKIVGNDKVDHIIQTISNFVKKL